ncbi:hypothetical protein RSOLAG1IB_12691 [Rhizoctonia solani AG-1 IB]|uniref:Uncharacterized protein n=1 Tax=Thanatephorus cucumeris (strain AG1-IB / isolate 7/3/14) TaxID=1108050 RepID=A0A0B7G568_THACB|nr:hypothetical protein RSOLAG1IB_12691 [Rhizoctonia solani AG-1 IB]
MVAAAEGTRLQKRKLKQRKSREEEQTKTKNLTAGRSHGHGYMYARPVAGPFTVLPQCLLLFARGHETRCCVQSK